MTKRQVAQQITEWPGLYTRVEPKTHKALRILAATEELTVAELVREGIEDLLKKYKGAR